MKEIGQMEPTKERGLKWILTGCVVLVVVSFAMIYLGDPFWNLYVIFFAWFIAAPVGVISAALLLIRRRRRQALV
jgi:hypothetical protein